MSDKEIEIKLAELDVQEAGLVQQEKAIQLQRLRIEENRRLLGEAIDKVPPAGKPG